jgi:uncharacterized membrane protein YjdF
MFSPKRFAIDLILFLTIMHFVMPLGIILLISYIYTIAKFDMKNETINEFLKAPNHQYQRIVSYIDSKF